MKEKLFHEKKCVFGEICAKIIYTPLQKNGKLCKISLELLWRIFIDYSKIFNHVKLDPPVNVFFDEAMEDFKKIVEICFGFVVEIGKVFIGCIYN